MALKKIYFEGGEYVSTLRGFLDLYFDSGSPATYFTEGEEQCPKNRRRSLNDLYWLVVSKFPEATKEEFANTIIDIIDTSKNQNTGNYYFYVGFCITIDRFYVRPINEGQAIPISPWAKHFLDRGKQPDHDHELEILQILYTKYWKQNN